jgi:hypothetical protein
MHTLPFTNEIANQFFCNECNLRKLYHMRLNKKYNAIGSQYCNLSNSIRILFDG